MDKQTLINATLQRVAAVLNDNVGNRLTPALIDGVCAHVQAQLDQALPPPLSTTTEKGQA